MTRRLGLHWLSSATLVVLLVFGCGSRQGSLGRVEGKVGQLLPQRVRRLTNAELERSVHALLGVNAEVASRLPPDVRQDGYSPNADQSLVAAVGVRWAALADELAHTAATRSIAAPCESDACREHFIAEYARRAWRRPLLVSEQRALSTLYDRGRAEGGAALGVEVTLSALMQAPSFLYVTELGALGDDGAVVSLTQHEIASALAFTLSGAPPDEPLLKAADDGVLGDAQVRRQQAWRILGQSSTRHHFRQFVLEWLEVDELYSTAKDPDQFAGYEQLKQHMLDETSAYVDEVMVNYGASVGALLGSGFSSVDPSMARYYGLSAFGPVVPLKGTGRAGVLQHASFLSAHSHPDTTSPVLRGDFILRRVLCRHMPRPSELGIEVVMPAPEQGQTTRERFLQHTADPACQTCHQLIDPLGFAFEDFDAAGGKRATEQGKAIDTRVTLKLDGEALSFDSSEELAYWLANSRRTERCFARQAFRYFSGQSNEAVEAAFLNVVEELPRDQRGSLIQMLVAYAGSELFDKRRQVR